MKKLLKNNLKNAVTVFLLVTIVALFVCVGWFGLMGFQQSRTDYDLLAKQEYERKKNMVENTVAFFLSQNPDVGDDLKQELRENLENQTTLLNDMIAARNNGDWERELFLAVEQGKAEQILAELGLGNSSDLRRIALNQYLLDNRIEPKVPTNACDGLNAMVMYAQWFLPSFATLFPLLFAIFQFLPEKKHGGMKFLLQIPISRSHIMHSKFLTATIQAVACLFMVTAGLFLFCSTVFGIGDIRYPISLAGGGFLATGDFIAKVFPGTVCSILFFSALGILLSVLIRNETILTICALAIPVVNLVFQNIGKQGAFWLPFFSVNIAQLVLHGQSSLLFVSLIQLLSMVLCDCGALIIFKKKDLV